jgi:acyl carrier protein
MARDAHSLAEFGPESDFNTLVGSRLHDDCVSTIGFYSRRERSFALETQQAFLARCAAVADRLEASGDISGKVVMVASTSPEGALLGYFGAIMADAVPVLLPVRPSLDPPATVAAVIEDARASLPDPHLLLQLNGGEPCVDPGVGHWTGFEPAESSDSDAPTRLCNATGDPDRPLHLQFTSGSTGRLNAVVMTHANILAETSSRTRRTGSRPGDHHVSWLPMYHDMGLIGMALLAFASGANLRLMTPFDFLSDPSHWLQAVAESSGVITAAPNFAFDYAVRRSSEAKIQDLDLSSWKKCYCGAEPVDRDTVERFLARFSPLGLDPSVVQPTYGLAEAGLMASMPFTGELPKALVIAAGSITTDGPIEVLSEQPLLGGEHPRAGHTAIACLGTASDDVIIEIVDSRGTPVTADDIAGEVFLSGGSITPGYLTANGTIDTFPDGRCPTGDIGFMHRGELYLVERLKNIIIKNGQNYSAAAFERALASRADLPLDSLAVIDTSMPGTHGGVTAVAEAPRRSSGEQLPEILRQAIADLELPIDEIVVVPRNGIPRTTSGKKQHAELRRQLRDKTIAIAWKTPTEDPGGRDEDGVLDLDRIDDEAKIIRLIERHARRRGWAGPAVLDTDRLAADLGYDSLTLIELVTDLERETGHAIPEERLPEIVTIADVIQVALDGSNLPGLTDAITAIAQQIPQIYRRVDLQIARQLRIDGRWITDFGSVNYLGLDLHPEVISSIGPAVEEWGVHPSWTRAVASPAPYYELESRLAQMIGAPEVMMFSTITLLHFGVLPLLATGADTLILDIGAHNSVAEAAELAGARGADLRQFSHTDLATLETALAEAKGRPVIALNGVYSMTGGVADLHAICDLARNAGALVYIDDAHGFGVLGANPTDRDPYGRGGGGTARYLGLDYDNLVYVAGLSKAFSSMGAFVSVRNAEDRALFERASTSIFSGPIPIASMASALAGLDVNQREGDQHRRHLHHLTNRVISEATELGFPCSNHLTFPIVNLMMGNTQRTVRACQIMWRLGILFTPSAFPAAPLDRGGARISLTAANTDDEVDQLIKALASVHDEIGPPPRLDGVKLLGGQH